VPCRESWKALNRWPTTRPRKIFSDFQPTISDGGDVGNDFVEESALTSLDGPS
jgi:hypothetical protein